MKITEEELLRTMVDMYEKTEGRKPTQLEIDLFKEIIYERGIEGIQTLYDSHYYHYDFPDYRKDIRPIKAPLDVLEVDDDNYTDVESMPDDSYDVILERMRELPHEDQVSEVTNLVMTYLSRWHYDDNKDDDDISCYPLRVAVALMEDCKLHECVSVYLEILRQDAEFYKYFFKEDDLDFMLPGILYQLISKEDLPMLLDFMKTPGLLFPCKKQVALAVATLPRKDSSALPLVQDWLAELLKTYMPVGTDSDLFDENLLDTLAYCCIHTRAVSLKDTIVRMYSKYKIPPIFVKGGSNEVRKTIKNASVGALEEYEESGISLFREYLEEDYDDDYDDEGDDDGEDNYDDDDEFDLNEYDWQEFQPYSICNKAEYKPVPDFALKQYTLHVRLQGIKPEIWRDIEVPSNLKLTSLAGVILTAMGWDEDHLHQFITQEKKSKYYATSFNELSLSDCDSLDGRKYCIGNLLKKVGEKITFEYDYGDGWRHTLTLSAINNIEKPVTVKLLDGKRACPPEDCGGIQGYMDICKVMQNMDTARAHETIDWLGCKYDSELFPLKLAQRLVAEFNR